MTHLTKEHKEVTFWLEDIFGSGKVPPYEVNDHTITHLYQMYSCNKEADRIASLAIDDVDQKTEEYKEEAHRLQEILKSVGFSIPSLSNVCKQTIMSLAELALLLNIRDTSTTNYILVMSELSEKLADNTAAIERAEENIKCLLERFNETKESLNYVYSVSNSYSTPADCLLAEKRRNEAKSLRNKTEKYLHQISELESSTNIGYKDIHHNQLMKLAEDLKDLKEELKPMANRLKTYKSLPPDLNLAKVKVEEAKRQLVVINFEYKLYIIMSVFLLVRFVQIPQTHTPEEEQ